MTDVAPGIVTFGLGSGPDAMIIGNIFNLGFFKVDVGVGSPIIPPAPPPLPDGGGGSRPLAPGEIQNFYKVVDNQYQLLPTDRKIPVTIKVTFRGKTTEKYYLVGKKRADIIVTIINLQNRIKDGIAISVKSVKNLGSRISAFVRNVRNKDEDQ